MEFTQDEINRINEEAREELLSERAPCEHCGSRERAHLDIPYTCAQSLGQTEWRVCMLRISQCLTCKVILGREEQC